MSHLSLQLFHRMIHLTTVFASNVMHLFLLPPLHSIASEMRFIFTPSVGRMLLRTSVETCHSTIGTLHVFAATHSRVTWVNVHHVDHLTLLA